MNYMQPYQFDCLDSHIRSHGSKAKSRWHRLFLIIWLIERNTKSHDEGISDQLHRVCPILRILREM
jgi:hypothetical protein